MGTQKESLTRKVAIQYIDDTVIDFDRKLEAIGMAEPWLLTANAADLAADRNSFYRASLTYKEEGVARLNDAGMAELLDKCRTLSNLYNLSVHIPQGDLIVQKEALSNDHVTVFRRKMYEIACQRLDANRTELDAMQARYEAYFGKSKGAQRNDMSFEQLRNAIEKDKELQRKDETLCVEQGDAFDKLKNAPDYQPFIDNLQTIKDFRSDIAHSRYLIRKAFPEIDSVSGERISYKTNNAQILEKMIKSFDRARKAQDEVRAKIDSGDMPLYKLDPIVDATKAFYGITDKSTDEFGKAVNAWLASERSKDCVIKILSTVVSLGLAAACFIPGIGVGAVIALGAIGAGVGVAGAVYEFEMADDLNDAGESQRAGSSKIIADADAARKEYVWGIVNICLASVDLFLSGAQVVRVGKVLSKFDTVAEGSRFLNKVGDAKDSMTFLNRMDSLPNGKQVLQKLDKATGDTANEVVRFFNGLDDAELSRGVGVFNKYDTADDFVKNGLKTGKAKQSIMQKSIENPDHIIRDGRKKVLKPNYTYTTDNGYKYITDEIGRIDNVEGTLTLGKAKRNPYAQKTIGGDDRLDTDQGGHLIASIFNGSGDIDNLIPMNSNLNQGVWKAMENSWVKALNDDKTVEVMIDVIYSETSKRPSDFFVTWYINGERYAQPFKNIPRGGL